MQKHELKLRKRLGLGKLTRKVLRLLGADAQFAGSSIVQGARVNISHYSQREIRSALLDAEHKKAEVLREWQKHQKVC